MFYWFLIQKTYLDGYPLEKDTLGPSDDTAYHNISPEETTFSSLPDNVSPLALNLPHNSTHGLCLPKYIQPRAFFLLFLLYPWLPSPLSWDTVCWPLPCAAYISVPRGKSSSDSKIMEALSPPPPAPQGPCHIVVIFLLRMIPFPNQCLSPLFPSRFYHSPLPCIQEHDYHNPSTTQTYIHLMFKK